MPRPAWKRRSWERSSARKDITKQNQAVSDAREALDAAVQKARLEGCTWAEIGEALGVTRQAAENRFRHVKDRPRPTFPHHDRSIKRSEKQ